MAASKIAVHWEGWGGEGGVISLSYTAAIIISLYGGVARNIISYLTVQYCIYLYITFIFREE